MTRPRDPDIATRRETAPRTHGSFFGRRKGHKLRAHQADLIESLLPRLALDISHSRARPISPKSSTRRSTMSGSKSDSAAASIWSPKRWPFRIPGSSAASPMSTAWQRS